MRHGVEVRVASMRTGNSLEAETSLKYVCLSVHHISRPKSKGRVQRKALFVGWAFRPATNQRNAAGQEAYPTQRAALIVTQRHHRIHSHRPPRRNTARRQRDRAQCHRHRDKRNRVGPAAQH
jgi:hypothetical protein